MQQHWKREAGKLLLLGTAEGVGPVPTLLYAMASQQVLERGIREKVGKLVYEQLISTFDWYEFANFARRDKIFGDVFATYVEFSAHDSEQALPIWVEHARPGISRAINISNQGPKFASKPKWQNLRRDGVRPGRVCVIHHDDRISRPGRCST